MDFTDWLQRQIDRLECEIVASQAFDTALRASPKDLEELKTTIVVYRFLQQELQQRTLPAERSAQQPTDPVRVS
jgi:hypothetical protein